MPKLFCVKAHFHSTHRPYGVDEKMYSSDLMIVLSDDVHSAEEKVRAYLFNANDPDEKHNMRFDLIETSEIETGTAHWMIDGFIV